MEKKYKHKHLGEILTRSDLHNNELKNHKGGKASCNYVLCFACAAVDCEVFNNVDNTYTSEGYDIEACFSNCASNYGCGYANAGGCHG